MDSQKTALARDCLEGAETDRMTFPQVVTALMQAGFDGYLVDFRRAAHTYYLPDGDSLDLAAGEPPGEIPRHFDTAQIKAAIRAAQTLAPGYSYKGFCAKVAAAGCAGYLISFPGRRALYFGRTGETHVEHFPPT